MSEPIRRAAAPIAVDGDLKKEVWTGVSRSQRFGDLETGCRQTLFDTWAAMQWDDRHLYVAFWLEDRDVCCTGARPSPLGWEENCAEILVAGAAAHGRIAVNPAGRVSTAFFIFKDGYQRGGRYDVPEFDLAAHQPSVFGGDAGPKHRRGMRWGFLPWQIPGLQVGVRVNGALDDRSSIDRGWTAEIAVPWEALKWLAPEGATSLNCGDAWRLVLLRRQVVDHRAERRQALWTWQPLWGGDLFAPESYMDFVLA